MADTLQHGSISGSASVRQGISGEITIGGKIMKELRFLPYSEFPEIGREETLYIDTDNNAMYYYNGSTYVALSGGGGGGTDNYNALTNKPSVNSVTLIGNKTSSELGLQELIADLSTIRSGAASGSTAVQPETLETALSEKQDVINDLDDIRAGAELGKTAVQPSDMEVALADKQDTISDLATIRSGAASGATAVQPSDMEAALADKQDVISDLDAIRSGATAGAIALQPEDVDTLPTDGSSNPVSSGGTYNFVNSSIATNTAYFIGTFASVAELEAYTGTVTNNDYAFVTSTDSAGNTLYNRYKYNSATQEWSFEYAVNNTAFTAAQWAAIQSGLTASDKTKLDGIETGANKTVIDASPTSGSSNAVSSGGVYTALSGKQDIISDLSDIRSGASAGATAVQPSALNYYQTKLSGTNKLDPAYIEYDATHRAVSDTEKSTWNGKQDTISDLSTIRSGAAAGATALQQSDVSSTYSASGTAPVNGTAVNAAIETLDVSSVGGSGKYISAISETNGKISATETTMDTTPTANSTVPVTSGGVATDQARQEVEIGAVANRGAKNFAKTTTVSFTTSKQIELSPITGTVVFSARNIVSDDTSASQCAVFFNYSDGTSSEKMLINRGDNASAEKTLGKIATMATIYASDTTAHSTGKTATFTDIMIRRASITDSTFVPYAKTNVELTVAEDEDRAALVAMVDGGAKNRIVFDGVGTGTSNVGTSYTSNGITFKMQSDGTVHVTGTILSGNSYCYFYTGTSRNNIIDFFDGNHVLSGNPQGASVGTYRLWYKVGSQTAVSMTGSSAVLPAITGETNAVLGMQIDAPQTNLDITFKPMICTAADWAVSQKFVPYAPTNRELYEMIQELQNNS